MSDVDERREELVVRLFAVAAWQPGAAGGSSPSDTGSHQHLIMRARRDGTCRRLLPRSHDVRARLLTDVLTEGLHQLGTRLAVAGGGRPGGDL